MAELTRLIVGTIIVILGLPLGSLLARITKDELKQGQVWFRLIILVSIIGAFVGIVLRNDIILFSFLFILAVTSRSIKTKRKN